ncbi:hypothetical protein V6N12_053133 [Hibiscus sabdariffa]|uniref:Uncharacterized protein n=1 Tax=Hibiscus sabdariffa TaxID=183260 RepID=A0ABR2D9F6_9ROSI
MLITGAVSVDNSGNEDVILRSEPESINADNEDVRVREEEVPVSTLREEQVFENSDHWREEEVPAATLREEQVLECPERAECVYVLPESLGGQQQHGTQGGEQQAVNTHPMLTRSCNI